MSKKKSPFNWYFVLAGALLLSAGIFKSSDTNEAPELTSIMTKVSTDMLEVNVRRNHRTYKFWTEEHEAQFSILDGSVSRDRHDEIELLRKGEQLQLEIKQSELNELSLASADVTVYGLSSNGVQLLSQEEFQENRRKYKKRLSVVWILTCSMLLLNGFLPISNKLNMAIIGTLLGIAIFLRMFDLVLY